MYPRISVPQTPQQPSPNPSLSSEGTHPSLQQPVDDGATSREIKLALSVKREGEERLKSENMGLETMDIWCRQIACRPGVAKDYFCKAPCAGSLSKTLMRLN